MRQLAIALGIFATVGCDDSVMNLGPNSTHATGGNAASSTTTTDTSYRPPWSAISGGSSMGGNLATGGVSNLGGNLATGGTSVTTTAAVGRLELNGLESFSCDFDNSALEGWIPSKPPCKGSEPATYRVDLATKMLSHEYCAPAPDGSAAVTQLDSRVLSDAEMTACMMLLEQVSLDHGTQCGADRPVETLSLRFDNRAESYRDDFYAGCQPVDPRLTYVANLDWLTTFLSRAMSLSELPTDYDSLEIAQPTASDVEVAMVNECGTGFIRSFEVDLVKKQAVEKDCARTVDIGGTTTDTAELRTTTKPLSDTNIEYLRTRISQLHFGAARQDCSTREFASLAWLYRSGETVASLLDGRAACPGATEHSGQYTVELNDVYWVVNELFHPSL